MMAGPRLAEVQLAWGDPGGALAVIERVLPVNAVDPRAVDELMVWGARVIGDLVERARDDRDEDAVRRHLESLDRLVGAAPSCLASRSSAAENETPSSRAWLRCMRPSAHAPRAVPTRPERWRDVTAACAAAGMEWERQCSSWRLASVLVCQRPDRGRGR